MNARPLGWSVIALCALFLGSAAAAPPPHAGGGKGGPPAHAGSSNGKSGGAHGKSDHGKPDRGPSDRGRDDARHGEIRFHDDHRVIVRDYYGDPGHCPPGLAKKRNGCMPPGQAKKWHVGQRLPRDVVYHDLPRDLIIRLPPLSVGYKYVRVGADILQIAVGTGLVIDAIQDLGRM